MMTPPDVYRWYEIALKPHEAVSGEKLSPKLGVLVPIEAFPCNGTPPNWWLSDMHGFYFLFERVSE